MLKRGAHEATLSKRKRRRNGVSASSSILDIADTQPGQSHLMRFWHTNAEDPATSRLSEVPIPSKPQIEEANIENMEENFSYVASAAKKTRARPKRKRGNDSVGYNSNVFYELEC
jgi:hypothetical protein